METDTQPDETPDAPRDPRLYYSGPIVPPAPAPKAAPAPQLGATAKMQRRAELMRQRLAPPKA